MIEFKGHKLIKIIDDEPFYLCNACGSMFSRKLEDYSNDVTYFVNDFWDYYNYQREIFTCDETIIKNIIE